MKILFDSGFNVPEPYEKFEKGYVMQYIDNGILWNLYQAADVATQSDLIDKFTKLLFDLHSVKPKSEPPHGGFIKNELEEIKSIINEKQIDHYREIFDKLETLSIGIKEYPSCYIHRDYHVWNVLTDKNHKLYLIDMELKQGDYRFDVGWTYMLQSRSAVHDARHGKIAEAFLTGYYELQPKSRNDIEYFKQLANLRWLVNVAPLNKTDKHWFPEMKDKAEQAFAEFLKA
jgi:aminoglycoside phosphotransferase (APT) family kinase protein